MIKIKSIEFLNDEVFGNRVFDFTINGRIASTIVLAGLNGSGKTRLLKFIYDALNRGIHTGANQGIVCAYIILDITSEGGFSGDKTIDTAKIICRKADRMLYEVQYYSDGNRVNVAYQTLNNEVTYYYLHIKTLFSTVDINYNPLHDIKSVSNSKLDNDDTTIPNDLASEIIQLLVDIKVQDNNDIAEYIEDHEGKNVPESKRNIRTKRFNTAFYKIFDKKLRFKGLENNTIPIFQKGNNRIKIKDLSSGEKQIVFRGTYLLRNHDALDGVPVLIDEPEISMHPSWNKKIYNFYRRLFNDNNNKPTSQLIIATHSEYVIESALEDSDCVITKMDNNDNKNYGKEINDSILEKTTSAEIKYSIFDVPTIDFHIQLYSYIQNNLCNQTDTIKQIDNYLLSNNSPTKYYSYRDRNNVLHEYNSLCTYIRNCIDHPDENHSYTNTEFEKSLKYMIRLIKRTRN